MDFLTTYISRVHFFSESSYPVTDHLYSETLYKDLSVPVYTTLKGVSLYFQHRLKLLREKCNVTCEK